MYKGYKDIEPEEVDGRMKKYKIKSKCPFCKKWFFSTHQARKRCKECDVRIC